MNKKVLIVVLLLLLILGVYYFLFYKKQALILPTIQNLQEKQEISVEGIYIKNTIDEGVMDGGSYQIIDTKDYGQVKIVVGGFRSNCLVKEIYQPSIGEKVEVYGVVISDPNNNFFNGNQMSVCSSDKYYIRKIMQQEVFHSEKATESVSKDMKEYLNLNYNFKFNYPDKWTIEEKLFTDYYDIPDPIKGLVVVINNPSFPKKMYDCCYTPEEIEKYGKKPHMDLLIYDSVSDPKSTQYFGPKTIAILNQLVQKGYSKKNLETLLSFVPSYGIDSDVNGKPLKDTEWHDGCTDIKLLSINNSYVVKFSGCGEGVVENTGALFVRNDNLVFKLEDNASEYSRLGDFDKVLESFKFN